MAMKRNTEKGLTLVEILLALIVMVIGLAGILALFPVALQASKESFVNHLKITTLRCLMW